MPGKVYLVGAGPGDPGLLTLKGRAALERADCVLYDFLVNDDLLRIPPSRCERIFAGKRAGRHEMTQEEIHRAMIDRARAGAVVVRLKGGDPFIFGRGGEEAEALARAGIEFEVVSGVSAGSAAPAYAGIPLTHRGISSSVTFITGHNEADRIEAPPRGTIVVFMGARKLAAIAHALLAQGRAASTPAAVIRWGTTPDQQIIEGTLADIAAKSEGVHPPALAVIGEVVSLRNRSAWFERLPLFGKRVVITRPRGQTEALRQMLVERGAQAVDLPCIEIRDPDSWGPLDGAIRRLGEFDFLLLTSVNGVEKFMGRLEACGLDARGLKGITAGAIGPATAAGLARHGIRADFVPAEYRAEGLIEELEKHELRGKRFLIPRARVARDLVPSALQEKGARVEVVEAYWAAPPVYRPDELEALLYPAPHVITFTSSSTATNFFSLPIPGEARQSLAGALIASIGPVTSATLVKLGLKVDIEAAESTVEGLVAALEKYFQTQRAGG